MTEEEAKTKWCPFARVPRLINELRDIRGGDGMETARIASVAVPVNRNESFGVPAASLCIASDCMAWRLEHEMRPILPDGSWAPLEMSHPYVPERRPYPTGGGYCGLAGQPT